MENVILYILQEWGPLGALIVILGGMCWGGYKIYKSHEKNVVEKKDDLKKLEENIADQISVLVQSVKVLNEKVDVFNDKFESQIEVLDKKIESLPADHIKAISEQAEINGKKHKKQLDDLMKLGPRLHDIMKNSNEEIGSDHIFLGSFHNGNSSLSGIPYYKFDIIAERFKPEKVHYDCEFAHMYKDSDILRYDMLPITLVQKGMVHFVVPEAGSTELSEYDDIIWRRMRGRGIRQIALCLLRDSKRRPSGFIGCVSYNMGQLNLDKLVTCGKELEMIYREAERSDE